MSAAHPLERSLDRFDVLSLDVFDTAILRRVARPVDLFALVAHDFGRRRPEANGLDFAAARVEAERRARERAQAAGRGEVTLVEIYAELDLPAAWRDELRALEIDLEQALCRAHPEVLGLYNEARRRGLRVVFVSDMYLPHAVIAQMLRASGYGDHALYLSSELGITKSDGELFDHVARDLGVAPHRILHVGDDRASDVAQARRRGLVAHHQPRAPTVPAGDIWSSVHQALIRERRHARSDDFWSRAGYELAGVLYLGFVSWVRTQALERGCERVYFLARDGWILQQVYQRLGGDPVASYLYASRRALNLPALVRLGEVELDFLSSGYTPLRVGDFLGRIGVDAIEHRAEIVAAGFGSAEERVGLDRRDRLRALFKRLEPVLLARAAAERSVAIDYLREQGVTDARKVAIVDLGWQGTLQRSLSTLLREAGAATELVGLYLGTFEHARAIAAQGLELHGWLCDFAEPARWYRAIRACVEIWEFLHAAPHGSVTGFVRGPRAVEPVLARDPAPPAQRAAADTLQRAALEYLDDALTVLHGRALAVTRETAAAPLERVVLDPTVEEATRFGELYHGEGFGDVVELRQIVPAPSWKARLGFPTRLRHEYDSAYWKQGYFARNPLARLRRDALTGRRA